MFFKLFKIEYNLRNKVRNGYSTLVQKCAPIWSSRAVVKNQIIQMNSNELAGKYYVLFFYPHDFTFVCPTEILEFDKAAKEFEKIETKVIGCSIDSEYAHLAWCKMKKSDGGLEGPLDLPLLSDKTRTISTSFGILSDSIGVSLRATFIVDNNGIVRHQSVNDTGIGRSIEECKRLVRAIQHSDKYGEVCPVGWMEGDRAIKPLDQTKFNPNDYIFNRK